MRIALAITPYFTNGDTPPLGLAYINAALSKAGHRVTPYDFIHHTLRDNAPFLAHFRRIVNLGKVGRRMPFFLNVEFTLYALHYGAFPKHKWPLPSPGPEKAAWAAAAMMLDKSASSWAETMLRADPEIVMLSAYTSNVFSTLAIAREIKRRSKAKVVIGGPGVDLREVYEWVLAAGLADGVIVGEGELTAVESANIAGDFKPIPGLAASGADFAARDFIADLDDLPPPLYDGLPGPGMGLDDYEALAENPYKSPFFVGLPVMSSRGCANRCAYCSEAAFWKKWRRRRPESVAGEIAAIKSKTGRDVFLFCDSALNLDKEWLTAFCERVAPLKARFLSYMVAHSDLDDAMAHKMYDAGWRGAVVGVETLSGRIRKLMRKKMSAAQAMDTLSAFAKADIWVKANILCGFPTETEDDVDETVAAMEKLNARPEVKRRLWWDAGHPLRLEPYSHMFRSPDKYGIEIEPYRIELPHQLAGQQPFVDRMTMKWNPGFSEETVAARSKRIIDAAHNPTE